MPTAVSLRFEKRSRLADANEVDTVALSAATDASSLPSLAVSAAASAAAAASASAAWRQRWRW